MRCARLSAPCAASTTEAYRAGASRTAGVLHDAQQSGVVPFWCEGSRIPASAPRTAQPDVRKPDRARITLGL